MTTFTATYSPDDNKIRLYASSRLPADLYARVKAAGFRWAPKQDLFFAPMWTPDREDLAIELAGELEDDDKTLADRAEERADRFEGYKDNRTRDAHAAHDAVSRIADNIPLGQPILVGHHSERHARRDAEKITNHMRRACKMWDTAKYWQARAAGALRHAKYKELPRVRANRIKTIEADKRRQERSRDEAARWIRLWAQLNHPHKGDLIRPGVREEGPPADDALRLRRALGITALDHVSIRTPDGGYGSSLWNELEAGRMTPREAQLRALRCHGRTIMWAKRWIAHYDHRLLYERAMLEEQGATDLLKPKPKSAAALLPLCNYRAPGGIEIANIYNRGEMMHYPQVEMTQAEYTRISADYKGTRVVDHSHRVRTTMQRHALVCVFLTDAKVHVRPDPGTAPEPKPRAAPRPMVERVDASRLNSLPAESAPFDAMRDSLKAGVQVVAAPQLFPTPADLARRLVDLAEIEPGHRVLEPSAGTGAIWRELTGKRYAIEIDRRLTEALAKMTRAGDIGVTCADFLEFNPEGIEPFDRIVMNPPFERGSDIKHILHAIGFLEPDGRLVAVCAGGPRQREALEPIAEAWIDLPAGTFADAGTNVHTAIVVITPASVQAGHEADDPHCTCNTCLRSFADQVSE